MGSETLECMSSTEETSQNKLQESRPEGFKVGPFTIVKSPLQNPEYLPKVGTSFFAFLEDPVYEAEVIKIIIKEFEEKFPNESITVDELLEFKYANLHPKPIFNYLLKELEKKYPEAEMLILKDICFTILLNSHVVQKLTYTVEDAHRLIATFHNYLALSNGTIFFKYSIDDKATLIARQHLFSPLLCSYINYLFESRLFITENTINYHWLIFVGYLLGHFDPTNPRVRENKAYFTHYLKDLDFSMHPWILQILKIHEHDYADEMQQERGIERPSGLEKLKQFWRKYFVNAWVAQVISENQGKTHLSTYDLNIARNNLSTTQPVAQSMEHAQKLDKSRLVAQGDTGSQYLTDFEAGVHHQGVQLNQNKKKLQKEIVAVFASYGIKIPDIFKKQGILPTDWHRLVQKSGLIFNCVRRHASAIFSAVKQEKFTGMEPSGINTAELIERLWSEIQDILEEGSADGTEDSTITKRLFGSEFQTITSFEKLMLLLYVLLTLTQGSKNKPFSEARLMTIQLISEALNGLLSGHEEINREETVQIDMSVVKIDLGSSDQQGLYQKAQDRLLNLDPSLGIVSNETKEAQEIITRIYETMSRVLPIFYQIPENKNQSLYEFTNFYHSMQDAGIILATLIINVWLKESFVTNKQIPALFYLLSVVTTYYFGLTAHLQVYKLRSGIMTRADFLRISPMRIENEKLVEKADHYREEYERSLFKWMWLMFMVYVISFGLISLTDSDFVNNFGEALAQIADDLFPGLQVPDFLSSLSSYELSAITGQPELPPLPEFMDTESLARQKHSAIGRVFQMPSDSVYYSFAWFRNDNRLFNQTQEHMSNFSGHISQVPDIDEKTHLPGPGELVYEINNPGSHIYPPEEFKFTHIYLVGTQTPRVDQFGTLIFFEDANGENGFPKKLLVVAERITPDPVDFAPPELSHLPIYDYGYQLNPTSTIYENWQEIRVGAIILNDGLSGDTELQVAHAQMFSELEHLITYLNDSDDFDIAQKKNFFQDIASQIITKYVFWLQNYIWSSRVYSLQFPLSKVLAMRDENPLFKTLRAITEDQHGFHCQLAQEVLRDFFGSVGVDVLTRFGARAKDYQGILGFRITHTNGIVILPNGKTLTLDLTPKTPNPGEDLSSLDDFTPDVGELLRQLQDPNTLDLLRPWLIGGSAAVVVGGVYYRNRKRKGKHSPRRKRKSGDVYMNPLARFEQEYERLVRKYSSEEIQHIQKLITHIMMYVDDLSNPDTDIAKSVDSGVGIDGVKNGNSPKLNAVEKQFITTLINNDVASMVRAFMPSRIVDKKPNLPPEAPNVNTVAQFAKSFDVLSDSRKKKIAEVLDFTLTRLTELRKADSLDPELKQKLRTVKDLLVLIRRHIVQQIKR